jgi:hypothetical protein
LKSKKSSASELRERSEQLRAEQEVAKVEKEIDKRDDFFEAQAAKLSTPKVGIHREALI